MTTFENATTADFDRAAERMFYRDLNGYLAQQEQAELRAEHAEQDAEHTDPERFVPEVEFDRPSAQDYADLDRVLDWEEHSWTL